MSSDTTMAKRHLPFADSWHMLSTYQGVAIHLGLLGVAILFLHYRTFDWLFRTWWTTDRYSHGFLIPLIASYLVWIKREHLAQLPHRPSVAAGGLLFALSGFMLLAGRAGGYILVESISLLILLPGIVLFIWGPSYLRALILPLGYLQFMIPWTEPFIEQVSTRFQLLSAHFGTILLQTMGYSVFREGTYLQVSNVALEVAQECSGLSLLYSIVALFIPLVYVTQRTWWRAAGVLACGFGVTLLVNGSRVALVGIVSHYYGKPMLQGPLHILQGWFLAQIGIVLLFLINWAVAKLPSESRWRLHERWKGRSTDAARSSTQTGTTLLFAFCLLSLAAIGYYFHAWSLVGILLLGVIVWAMLKFRPHSEVRACEEEKRPTAQIAPSNAHSRHSGPAAVLIALLIGLGFYLHFLSSPDPVPSKKPLADLPETIATWHGKDARWFDAHRFFPGAAAETIRVYRVAEKEIFVYIGYFSIQRSGESLISPASSALRRNARELVLPNSIEGLQRVNYSASTIEGKQYDTVFWYRLPSGNVTGRYKTKLRQLLDAIVHRHNNGAVVLLAIPASENPGRTASVAELLEFATALARVLEEFLP